MKGERMTVKEAASALGMSPCSVRYFMRNKQLPIGYAVQPAYTQSQSRWEYRIYREMLYKYMGKEGVSNSKQENV